MRVELCCECSQPTGRAGRLDDSIYDDDGNGPFCEECWAKINPQEDSENAS
jgi:hypothetical protein